jgi:hypothetical protein
MILLISRCSVTGAAAGVRTWPGEALGDLVPHLYSLWLLNYQWLWLELDLPASWKEPGVDGVHMV